MSVLTGLVLDQRDRPLRNSFELDVQDILTDLPTGTIDPNDFVVTQDSGDGSFIKVLVSEFLSGSGSVTDGLNVGGGAGQVFKDKLATDLRFRTLAGGTGISIATAADEVSIAAIPSAIGALIDHSILLNLNWSATGHTIDTDFLPDTDRAHQLGEWLGFEDPGNRLWHGLKLDGDGIIVDGAPGPSAPTGLVPFAQVIGYPDVGDRLIIDHELSWDTGTGQDSYIMRMTGGQFLANFEWEILSTATEAFFRLRGSVKPRFDNSYDLGATSERWARAFFSRQVFLDGASDEIQLLVQGSAGQTADILVVENSAGTDLFAASPTQVKAFRQLFVDGGANEIQLLVQGAVGQTANLATFESSAGTDLLTINSVGHLGIVSAASATPRLSIAVNGTTNPGTQYNIGSSANERIISTVSGGFGWNIVNENSLTGNLQLRTNGADTLRFEIARDSNRAKFGSTAWGSWTPLGGEILGLEGLVAATGGATFNIGGGSTDPNSRFKVVDSAGSGFAFYVNPDTSTAGGIGFFTSSTVNGILNFASGRVSTAKAGLAIVLGLVTDNLTEWYSDGTFSAGAFGFGWISENSASGDRVLFAKNGTAANSTVLYCTRSNQFVGIGATFALGGTTPSFQLHVGGTFGVDSTSQFSGDITLLTGVDLILATAGAGTRIGTGTTQLLGFWNATPVARPSAFTQTYATATKTHANLTSATLTDSTTGTANTTVEEVIDNGDTTDNLTINNNFADVVAQINALRVDLENAKQVLNAVIDDDQLIGIKG